MVILIFDDGVSRSVFFDEFRPQQASLQPRAHVLIRQVNMLVHEVAQFRVDIRGRALPGQNETEEKKQDKK